MRRHCLASRRGGFRSRPSATASSALRAMLLSALSVSLLFGHHRRPARHGSVDLATACFGTHVSTGKRRASGRLIHPLWFGCDVGLWMRPRTVEAGGGHGHQYSHLLVAVG